MYQKSAIPARLVTILAMLDVHDAERVAYAFQFAAAAHAGQQRDEGTPYIEHPVAVVEILWNELGCKNTDMLLAALTHDVLEDCREITADVLRGVIGERALQLVEQVTKTRVPEECKAQRDREYMDQIRAADADARLLKLADRIHNLRSILLSDDQAKARRYLDFSRAEFVPLAMGTSLAAAECVSNACDAIERYLDGSRAVPSVNES